MNERDPRAGRPPRPELLAAYLDGELDLDARRQIEDWLAVHPEAAAEVEGQRQLLRLWQEAAPAEPSEARWAGVFAGIALAASSLPRPWPGRGWRAILWIGTAITAAAVAAAVAGIGMLHRPTPPTLPETPLASHEEIEPLSVVSRDDVEILSMDGDDDDTLVVGEPPVRGPIVLAANGDISLEVIRADPAGLPGVQMKEGATGPMLVVPIEAAVPPRED